MKADSISITIKQMSQIWGSYYLYPAQPDVPLCSIPPWVPPDSIIYNSDSLYPNKFVEIVNCGIFDGARLVTIAVYPLQYRPRSRRVFLVSNITFEFRLSPDNIPRRAQIRGINAQRTYDAILSAVVENDEEIPLYYQSPTLVPDAPPPQPLTPATYTIITNDAISGMMEAFQPFADWLTDKGIPAVVYPLSLALNFPGEDDAEKLRNFIIDAYTNYGTVWVLLGGDGFFLPAPPGLPSYIVPFRKGWARDDCDQDTFTPPSDLYFSDMNGKWDYDGDRRYGEPTHDRVDIYPEVFVGRILTRNPAETQNWVEKILDYERYGSSDLSLFRQTTWIYDSLRSNLYPWPQTRARFPNYFTHYNFDAVGANIAVRALNCGTGLYQIYCHGSSTVIATRGRPEWWKVHSFWDEYRNEQHDGLNWLDNFWRYYVVYSIGCYNAAYDDFRFGNNPGDNIITDTTIADAFTDSYAGKGAVAFLGNTRYGYYDASRYLHDMFCQLLFASTGSPQAGVYSLGAAEGWSKAYYNGSYVRHSHNLFGSPENEPWINKPGTLIVEHPTYIPVGQTVQFTVRVSTENGPLPSVRVCLHKNDVLPHEIYEIGWTDESGQVTFEVFASTEGVLKVTCFRPRAVQEQVVPNYDQYLPSQTICRVGIDVGGEQAEKSELPKELSLTLHSSISASNNLKLSYGIPKDSRIKLVLYDRLGRLLTILKDEKTKAGNYTDVFNLNRLSYGIYWLVLKSSNETRTKKLVIVR